jgi:hypothetical protein
MPRSSRLTVHALTDAAENALTATRGPPARAGSFVAPFATFETTAVERRGRVGFQALPILIADGEVAPTKVGRKTANSFPVADHSSGIPASRQPAITVFSRSSQYFGLPACQGAEL